METFFFNFNYFSDNEMVPNIFSDILDIANEKQRNAYVMSKSNAALLIAKDKEKFFYQIPGQSMKSQEFIISFQFVHICYENNFFSNVSGIF